MCIGRNYVAHARELNNPVPGKPFFFLKPTSSLLPCSREQPGEIQAPPGVSELHHEVELAVVVGKKASRVNAEEAMDYVKGYAIALDVTARDLQEKAKASGKPWTEAKGYDTFCPIGNFVDKSKVSDPHGLNLYLKVNGTMKQHDSTSLMIFRIPQLVEAVTRVMTLNEDDLILTGTPAGVGPML